MIKVVTDSAADLPPEIVTDLGIVLVPLVVTFEGETFLDGRDLSREEFWARAAQSHPTTAAPSPAAFAEAYERLAGEEAEGIVSIHLAASLSSVLANATAAAGDAGVPVRTVDSRSVGMGQGLVVLAAAGAASGGGALEEVLVAAEEAAERVEVFAAVESVEFLRRGGRVGAVKAAVSDLLRIRPVLSLRGGEPVLVAKCRTRGRALEELLSRATTNGPAEAAAVSHALAPDGEEFAERVHGALGLKPTISVMGAATGTHLGPGAIAVAVERSPA